MVESISKFIQNITEQKWHQVIYSNLAIASSIIIILSLFGISFIKPEYEMIIRYAIQTYIGFFLILRFNPFIKTNKITKDQRKFDRKVAFTAGIYILSTSIIYGVIEWIKKESSRIL